MPVGRLSTQDYVNRHEFLQQVWIDCQELFGVLPSKQQREIHRYYAVTKRLSADQLSDYRRSITKSDPSLPQRAGKDFQRLGEAYRAARVHSGDDEQLFRRLLRQAAFSTSTKGKDGRTITTAAIARPEIDQDRLTEAVASVVFLPDDEWAKFEAEAARGQSRRSGKEGK